jgi:NADH-quinone oxidoreductase subunit H
MSSGRHTNRSGGGNHDGLGGVCHLSGKKNIGLHAGAVGADARRALGTVCNRLQTALKLLTKRRFRSENADRWIFFVAPLHCRRRSIHCAGGSAVRAGLGSNYRRKHRRAVVLAVSSVGVLALILAGWSSNSKYALLGALRSSAQMVSYEVSMGLAIIGALMFARTLSLSGVVSAQASDSVWFLFYQPIGFVIF